MGFEDTFAAAFDEFCEQGNCDVREEAGLTDMDWSIATQFGALWESEPVQDLQNVAIKDASETFHINSDELENVVNNIEAEDVQEAAQHAVEENFGRQVAKWFGSFFSGSANEGMERRGERRDD